MRSDSEVMGCTAFAVNIWLVLSYQHTGFQSVRDVCVSQCVCVCV